MTDVGPFLTAIEDDDRNAVRSMLDADPSLAKREVADPRLVEKDITHWLYAADTPLHLAAAGYRVEIADLLIAAGAEVDSAENHRTSTPLHYAADGYINHPEWNEDRQLAMIGRLLEAGADIHARDKNGATPLHRAVRTRCAAAVEVLLAVGADPTSRNKPGSTPFHLAVQNTGRGGSGADVARAAQIRIIRSFTSRGIDPLTVDGKGKTVLDCARSTWVRELLD